MRSTAPEDLLEKATEVLSHVGETNKTRPLTCGSVRGRQSSSRPNSSRSDRGGAADNDVEDDESSTLKMSDSGSSDIEEGVLPPRMIPRPPVTSQSRAPTATATAAPMPGQPVQKTEAALPPHRARGGASRRSDRAPATEEGNGTLKDSDSLASVVKEGIVAKAAAAEKKTQYAEEALRSQETSAERRAADAAAMADRQFDLDEK